MIQFECVGPGIQNNRMKLAENEIRVFNLFYIDEQKYSGFIDLFDFCTKFDLPMVDLIRSGKFTFNLDELIELANKQEYAPGKPAEGFVCRPIEEKYSQELGGRLSFKVINENYALKYGE